LLKISDPDARATRMTPRVPKARQYAAYCIYLTCQVCIVRRVNEVVRQRMRHVFVQVELFRRHDGVLVTEQVA